MYLALSYHRHTIFFDAILARRFESSHNSHSPTTQTLDPYLRHKHAWDSVWGTELGIHAQDETILNKEHGAV